VYVPYYLLARSGLSALAVSSVLALAQSGIIWLTYELALTVCPIEGRSARTCFAVCAAALAFANPILINQLGTSYVDILTAEVVLAAWLLLVKAIRAPSVPRVLAAGLLLGAVTALKLTNAAHAVAACTLLLFVSADHRARVRYAAVFGVALAVGFLIVMVPWSIHLERHFGNPLFPLFNGLFRSPQFPTASLQDHRFIPDSLANALLRPLAIAAPVTMTDDEFAVPDLRYLVLLALAIWMALRWAWRKYTRREAVPDVSKGASSAWRSFGALGCAFLLDWTLWLAASGIGRYFIAMACVAGVLAIGLALRLVPAKPKVGMYLLAAIFLAQAFELFAGATYRVHVPWGSGPPFELSVPNELVRQSNLYVTFSEDSLSFLAPFVAPNSGFVSLEGDYVIRPNGADGAHFRALVERYAPHVRVVVLDPRFNTGGRATLPDAAHVNDTLAHFGLKAVVDDCLTIAVRDVRQPFIDVLPGTLPIHIPQLKNRRIRVPVSPDRNLVSCRVIPDDTAHAALFAGEDTANLVFDRLEDGCPRLFQPRRPVTEDYGDERSGYHWMRRYASTGLAVMITHGMVKLFDPVRGGSPIFLGREADWEGAPPRLLCGRHDERYYAQVIRPLPR
jgi:hypothetical protein